MTNYPYDYSPQPKSFPFRPQSLSGSNHAIIQSLIYVLGGRPEVPAPCCVPEKLDAISLLFQEGDDGSKYLLKNYPKMSVSSCSCQWTLRRGSKDDGLREFFVSFWENSGKRKFKYDEVFWGVCSIIFSVSLAVWSEALVRSCWVPRIHPHEALAHGVSKGFWQEEVEGSKHLNVILRVLRLSLDSLAEKGRARAVLPPKGRQRTQKLCWEKRKSRNSKKLFSSSVLFLSLSHLSSCSESTAFWKLLKL